MATKYLLPCSCGKAITVDISQAGDSARCECGTSVEVPSMRQLRQLQPAAVTAAPGRQATSWTIQQGLVFALGLFITAAGLSVAAYYQFGRASLDVEETPFDNLDESLQKIDEMNVSQLWDAWMAVRELGIGDYAPPNYVIYRHVSSNLLRAVWGGLAAAGVGLLISIGAFFLPKPSV